MALIPMGRKVLVRTEPKREKTDGGIIIPESNNELPVKGEVISVGNGEYIDGILVQSELEVGDTVIFSRYSGTELPLKKDDQKYLILSDSEILAFERV